MNNIEKIDLGSIDWKSSKEFFESITSELEKIDDRDESYNFTWVGKRKSIIESGTPIDKILRPDVEASKDFDNTENMLIVGDNLDALKILQESYLGQVKMIYIDPPYNTGHDFVYHDNFTVKKDEYEDGSVDENGDKIVSEDEFVENSKANGRFHSDWLSMMYPRLKLAQSLLSDDGVIFISIDDNEQANLKKICDEIFGEENFIGLICWQKKTQPSFLSKKISSIKEYLLFYQKSEINIITVGGFTNADKPVELINVSNTESMRFLPKENVLIENGRYSGMLRAGWYGSENLKIELLDEVAVKNGLPDKNLRLNGKFKWTQDTILSSINAGAIIHIKNTDSMRPTVQRPNAESGTKPILDLFSKKLNAELPTNTDATNEIKRMFDGIALLDYPKPTNLIKYILRSVSYYNKDSLILDFFAGSGTTGHAVMDLNAEDGGHRKYILVQLPEKTNEKSEARKAGYETIDQITAERLRRAGDKVQKERPDAKIDTGFRVFRIDSTNEHDNIRKSLDEYTQESMLEMVDNIKPERTPLDLLFGAIYASALPFDLKLETKQIDSNTVYLYGYFGEGSGLVACFDDAISEEAVKEIAKLKPIAAVFKDSSFADSAAKINLSEHFRILSVDTKVKVI